MCRQIIKEVYFTFVILEMKTHSAVPGYIFPNVNDLDFSVGKVRKAKKDHFVLQY